MEAIYTDTLTGISTIRNIAVDAGGRLIVAGGVGGSIATTNINRFGSLAPSVSDFSIGNMKICRLHFANYNTTQLFIQFHNSAAPLVSGVSVPASNEVFSVVGSGVTNPGFLFMGSGDWDKSGNWGANSRVAISTTRGVYTAPSAAILAQTTINIEITALV